MTPSDVLLEARDLIADPESWCQGHFFEEKHTKHCAMGATDHVTLNCFLQNPSQADLLRRNKALRYLYEAASPHQIVDLNDHLGHKAVMELYDQAIRLAKDAGE